MAAIAIDPLIAEARRRARRRRLAAAVVLAAGGLAVFLALRGSGAATAPPPNAADELRAIRTAAVHATIVASGLESGQRGWAMNGLGLWLTTDGGAHWRTVTPHVPGGDVVARIASVQFVDTTHGWASGLDLIGNASRFAMIERTVDGGRTWRTTSHDCAACGGSLSFVDARQGFSLTGGTLFASSDGGKRWHRVGAAPLRATIDFHDVAHGWALTAAGQLSRTTDGGRTWQRVPFPGVASLPQPAGAVAVRMGSRVVIEVPAGNRWTARRMPATVDPRFQVQFSAPTATDFVLWSRGRIWRSGDAGRTWSSFRPKVAPEQVWSLQFSSPDDGWAIFSLEQGAALVHTTNGGRDWLPLRP